jgi:hypothetical protein
MRHAATLEAELELRQTKFANAGEASDAALDLYARTASNQRRLLEGLDVRRQHTVVDSYAEAEAKLRWLAAHPTPLPPELLAEEPAIDVGQEHDD